MVDVKIEPHNTYYNQINTHLAKDNDIRFAAIVINSQAVTSASQTSLDLIGNQKNVVLFTELLHIGHVSIVGNNHTGFTLDGFNHEGSDIGTVPLKLGLQTRQIVVLDTGEARHVGAKASVGSGVVGTGNGRQSTAPEIVAGKDDAGLILRDALDVISPTTGELDGGLATLHSRVHGKDTVVTKVGGDKLGILTEGVIVKGAGGKCELLGLLDQRADNFGMAMSLIDGRVRREEIKVLLSIDIKETSS